MTASIEELLHYLHSHTLEEAKQIKSFAHAIPKVQDVKGIILQLELENPTIFKVLRLTKGDCLLFGADKPFHPIPGTHIQPVDAEGTLFAVRQNPMGPNQFWLVQYPPSKGEVVGRTVIEFYTNEKITGVFKTNNDNFGGEGSGTWFVQTHAM